MWHISWHKGDISHHSLGLCMTEMKKVLGAAQCPCTFHCAARVLTPTESPSASGCSALHISSGVGGCRYFENYIPISKNQFQYVVAVTACLDWLPSRGLACLCLSPGETWHMADAVKTRWRVEKCAIRGALVIAPPFSTLRHRVLPQTT
jgi:hypothetical protein